MPRIGEKSPSDLTWQEELGTEPVGGFPDVSQLNDFQLFNGLVAYVDYRNSTTGYSAKFWALYRDEFFKRINDEEKREGMLLAFLKSHASLMGHLESIVRVVNRGY